MEDPNVLRTLTDARMQLEKQSDQLRDLASTLLKLDDRGNLNKLADEIARAFQDHEIAEFVRDWINPKTGNQTCTDCKWLSQEDSPDPDHPEIALSWWACCAPGSPGKTASITFGTPTFKRPKSPNWCPGKEEVNQAQ